MEGGSEHDVAVSFGSGGVEVRMVAVVLGRELDDRSNNG